MERVSTVVSRGPGVWARVASAHKARVMSLSSADEVAEVPDVADRRTDSFIVASSYPYEFDAPGTGAGLEANTIVSGTKVLVPATWLRPNRWRAMSTFEQILGRVIAERRKSVGVTQEALADLCGVHVTYISQLERGVKSPTLRVFRSIAKALDTTGNKLLALAEAKR